MRRDCRRPVPAIRRAPARRSTTSTAVTGRPVARPSASATRPLHRLAQLRQHGAVAGRELELDVRAAVLDLHLEATLGPTDARAVDELRGDDDETGKRTALDPDRTGSRLDGVAVVPHALNAGRRSSISSRKLVE